jgi:hypothetical protein
VRSFDLFGRNTSPAEVSKLPEFLLDCLQSFTSLSVSDLNKCSMPAAVPLIQLVNAGDLHSEARNLGSKNSQIIHHAQDTFLDDSAKAG